MSVLEDKKEVEVRVRDKLFVLKEEPYEKMISIIEKYKEDAKRRDAALIMLCLKEAWRLDEEGNKVEQLQINETELRFGSPVYIVKLGEAIAKHFLSEE